MICPMLSQSQRDKEGNVVWNHHECIESACTFWAEDLADCGLRASGLLAIARAKGSLASAGAGDPQGPLATGRLMQVVQEERAGPSLATIAQAVERSGSVMRDTGLKLLEGVAGLEEPIRASGIEVVRRLDSLNASILAVTTSLEGRFRTVEEGVGAIGSALAQAQEARSQDLGRLEEPLTEMARRLGSVTNRFSALSERLEAVASQIGSLAETHDSIAAALSQEAERRREDEVRRRRDESRALNARGVALFHQGAWQAAEAAFRTALELDPPFAEAHNNLGLALGKRGDAGAAEESFRRALELDPGMAEAVNNLGFLFHQGMQFEKAVEMFRRSALTVQDSSIAYTNLGNACYKLGRYEEAVEAWEKAVRQDPLNDAAARALRMFQQEPAAGADVS